MRRFLTPAWLGLHALAIALVTAFVFLGWWQLRRAGDGNLRSWAYALEWPLFAAFVVAMWVKMIRDDLAEDEDEAEDMDHADHGADADVGDAESVAPMSAVSPDDVDDPELAAYNRYLARLNAEAAWRR